MPAAPRGSSLIPADHSINETATPAVRDDTGDQGQRFAGAETGDGGAGSGTPELRIIPFEMECLMLLYQQVAARDKALASGEQSLTMPNSTVGLLWKVYYMYTQVYHKRAPPEPGWKELIALLDKMAKVQHVCILGNPPSTEATEGIRTAEEQAQLDKARRRVSILDVRVFAKSIRTLHLKYMDIKRQISGVHHVVELILTDTTIECSMSAFSSLRSIHFDRSTINPKALGTLSYSLRSITATLYQRNVEPPLWRGPPAEEAMEDMSPWEALTHVRIIGSRMPLRLDGSWDQLLQLTHLTVSHVQLTSFRILEPVGKCANLVALDVSHNKIDRLTSLMLVGPNLKKLSLSYNRLQSVSGICELSKLVELHLDNNDVSEWSDIRDIADGCSNLCRLSLKGNPIAHRFEAGHEKDIYPFCASCFQFRPLILDGVDTAGTKKLATSQFFAKYMVLCERAAPRPEDRVEDRASARGSVMSYGRQMEGGTSFAQNRSVTGPVSYTGRDRSHSVHSRGREETGSQGRHSTRHHHRSHSLRHTKALAVVVDRPPLDAELPPDPTQQPDQPDEAFFRRLNVKQLQEKYGDKWQEHAAALAQSAYRDFTGIPKPLPDDPSRARTSKSPTPADPEVKESRRRRHHRSDKTSASQSKPEASISAASPPAVSMGSAAARSISLEGEQRAILAAEMMRQRLQTAATQKESSPTVTRKDPIKPPSATLQELLGSLSAADWSVLDGSKKRKVYANGIGLVLSAISEENIDIWEVGEPGAMLMDSNPIEVMIHDQTEKPSAKGRFDGKTLYRFLEYTSGYNKYIKLEVKVGPRTPKDSSVTNNTTFGKIPVMTLAIDSNQSEPLTQPLEIAADVLPLAGEQMSASRRTGVGLFSNSSKHSDGFDDFDAGSAGAQRQMHRMTKPRFLGGFVVPTGDPTKVFHELIVHHLKANHSRLAVSGINNIWPRTVLDDENSEMSKDRQLPVKINLNFIKERGTSQQKQFDLTRQRTGCSLAIKGDDLFITLQTYIFDARLVTKNTVKVITYTNLVKEVEDGASMMEYEDSALIIVTTTHLLMATDRNFKTGAPPPGMAPQPQRGPNHAQQFPDAQTTALATLTTLEADFDLQALKLQFTDGATFKFKTRDAGVTLAIIGSLLQGNHAARLKMAVRPCRVPTILAAPLVFSAAIFVSPLANKAVKKAKDNPAFPLRETRDVMVPARLILTASEVCLYNDFDMDEEIEKSEDKLAYDERILKRLEIARRPLTSIRALRVAGAGVFPLVFGLELTGAKREIWAMAAQNPNTIAHIHGQLREQCPKLQVIEISQSEHDNLQ